MATVTIGFTGQSKNGQSKNLNAHLSRNFLNGCNV